MNNTNMSDMKSDVRPQSIGNRPQMTTLTNLKKQTGATTKEIKLNACRFSKASNKTTAHSLNSPIKTMDSSSLVAKNGISGNLNKTVSSLPKQLWKKSESKKSLKKDPPAPEGSTAGSDMKSNRRPQTIGNRLPMTILTNRKKLTVATTNEQKLNACPLNKASSMVNANSNSSHVKTADHSSLMAKNFTRGSGLNKTMSSLPQQLWRKRESEKSLKKDPPAPEGCTAGKTVHSVAKHDTILKNFRSSRIRRLDSNCAAAMNKNPNSRPEIRCAEQGKTAASNVIKVTKSSHYGRSTTPAIKTLKPKLIRSESSSCKLRDARFVASTDASSQGSSQDKKNSKVCFNLNRQTKLAKKSNNGPNLVKQEINVLTKKREIVVESDPDILNGAKVFRVTNGSNLDMEMEFALLEKNDRLAITFGTGEMDLENLSVCDPTQHSANEIFMHPEPFLPEKYDPAVKEPSDSIDTPSDVHPEHKQVMSTSMWSETSRADIEHMDENESLKSIHLNEENSRLLKELKACQCDLKKERDRNRAATDTRENNKVSAELERLKQALKVQEVKLKLTTCLHEECREMMDKINAAAEHKLGKTAKRSRKSGTEMQVLKSRCGALEDSVVYLTDRRREIDNEHSEQVRLLQKDLHSINERLKVETNLRKEYEKELAKNEEFVKRSDAEGSRVINHTDHLSRHLYPRRDETLSEMKMPSRFEAKEACTKPDKARAEAAKVRAERDQAKEKKAAANQHGYAARKLKRAK